MHNSKTLKNHRFATIVQILLREKEKIKNKGNKRERYLRNFTSLWSVNLEVVMPLENKKHKFHKSRIHK